MNMFSLEGKVAVITGGGSGIGLASARRFAKAGANVFIACRTDGTALAREFGGTYIRTDVAEEDQVKRLMDTVGAAHGRIDVVVNNAGYAAVGEPTEGRTSADMQRHLQVNLMGTFYGTKYAAPYLHRGASVINVASIAGVVAIPTYAPYVSAKFAIVGLTKTCALEMGPRGIRVNAVCPGTIDTPINQAAGAEAEYELVKYTTALQRHGEADEVAALIHFLAADDSSYITGAAIVIDGGWLAGPSLGTIEKLLS